MRRLIQPFILAIALIAHTTAPCHTGINCPKPPVPSPEPSPEPGPAPAPAR